MHLPEPAARTPFRHWLDRAGVLVSGLCVVHCLSSLVLVTFLGLGGGILLRPEVHETGLAIALVIGALGLGFGALRHGRFSVLVTGLAGIVLMGLALRVEHGWREALLTIAGVSLLAAAHIRNLRHSH
jgi:hypothetical protein